MQQVSQEGSQREEEAALLGLRVQAVGTYRYRVTLLHAELGQGAQRLGAATPRVELGRIGARAGQARSLGIELVIGKILLVTLNKSVILASGIIVNSLNFIN